LNRKFEIFTKLVSVFLMMMMMMIARLLHSAVSCVMAALRNRKGKFLLAQFSVTRQKSGKEEI
jgi:hypothetical protein